MEPELTELTGEETRAILDQITALVEKLSDASYGKGDAESGKVVWPPVEDMSHADAMATCFDFADGELTLSFRSVGNELNKDDVVRELCVSWQGTQSYDDSPGCYGVQPLKKLLKDEYEIYVEEEEGDSEEEEGDSEVRRLLTRLIEAFDEPASKNAELVEVLKEARGWVQDEVNADPRHRGVDVLARIDAAIAAAGKPQGSEK